MKRNIIIYGYILIHLLFTSLLAADEKEKVYGLMDLVKSSEFIVRGKVIRIETYEKEPGRRYSDVYFQIIKSYKGKSIEGSDIVLTVFGGIIGESKVFTLIDPQFEDGQQSILFLRRFLPKDQMKYRYYITGLAEGKFNIVNENGQEFLLRDKYMSTRLKVLNNNRVNEISNSQKILLDDFISNLNNSIN
jgi:hypothetical protein